MKEVTILDVISKKVIVKDDKDLEFLKGCPNSSFLNHCAYFRDEPIKTSVDRYIVPIEQITTATPVKYLPSDYKHSGVVREMLNGEIYLEETTYFCVDPTQNKLLKVWFKNYQERYQNLQQHKTFLEGQLDLRKSEVEGYEINLATIKNASFWQRLKWLFTGVKI